MAIVKTQYRRNKQRGFTLIEVTLALVVFLMMTVMFAAVFPITVRSSHYSNWYSQAALLAQHKVDQVRSAGISQLNYTDLQNLGIVDQSSTATGPTYSFTTADNLDQFFPAGSTGQMTIVDYSTLANVPNPPPPGNVYMVTVTIQWQSGGSAQGSYSTSAMIISMVHR